VSLLFSMASGARETRKKERRKKFTLVNWMMPAAEDCGRSMDVVVKLPCRLPGISHPRRRDASRRLYFVGRAQMHAAIY
jgi:hypothetical protein